MDHTPWEDIRTALMGVNYQGAMVIESFTSENIVIATEGLAFLRRLTA